MNITILDDYQDAVRTLKCYSKLTGHHVTIWNDHTKDVGILAERLKDTEALVLIRERTPITAPLLERLGRLKLISQGGVYPHIDVEACTQRGIVVSSELHPAQPSYVTAELTLGLIISAMRKMPQEMAALRSGRWQSAIGLGLRGRTLGVFGYGRIGGVMASYGKALGMKVLVWGRPTTLAKAQAAGYATAASNAQFFEESDVVTLHLRMIKETRGIVGAAELARMKPTALIVNTSRAGLIDTDALVAALRAGRPGMAALDVFDEEPLLDVDHPLLTLPNVTCTPHIGFVERDAFESKFSVNFDQVLAYFSGRPINVINPEVLKS